MAKKRTYSVRLEDEQRQQLEARAGGMKMPVGELIRIAISDYLKQEAERDYLSDVETRIAASINRLGRQVERDRSEQQLVVGMLDSMREWLAFTLPTPVDKTAATDLMAVRNELFYKQLPLSFVSKSKAKVTSYMEADERLAETCPVCGTGKLKCKRGKKGLFWYCTNWDADPKCVATFPDDQGRALIQVTPVD